MNFRVPPPWFESSISLGTSSNIVFVEFSILLESVSLSQSPLSEVPLYIAVPLMLTIEFPC